ncbi:MAG: AarF/ABC1/UbiB kinase family protein [Chloroflexi bacterium]|nr:AarF/ABC1/UbiB kinase family protein [Chloroflexota bacterium]
MAFRLPFQQQVSDLARAREIVDVVMRHGLGVLAQQWELTRFLPRGRRSVDAPADSLENRLTTAQRARLAIEELGPTFIKLGQLASTRADIFPAEFVAEFEKLLDAAPPVPFEQVRAVLQAELGEPIDALFASFEANPLASASIGQVHRAVLHSGEHVVVKVQRPGIERVINADLDLLLGQARFVESRSERVRRLNLVKLVEEFAYALRLELDYTSEARNGDRFRKHFADDSRLLIPKVYWHLTTRRVLVSEELHGIKINDVERLAAEGYDLPAIAQMGTQIYMQQIFGDGFFHADPHPANIFVVGGQIAQIDFGTVGYLTDALKDQLVDLLVSLVRNDADGIALAMIRLGGDAEVNEAELRRDVQRFMMRFYGLSLKDVRIGDFLGEVFRIANRHHIILPADFALLGRTFIILEGVARQLDPHIVLVEVAQPFATQLVRERLSPEKIGANVFRSLRETNALAQALPRRIDNFLARVDTDKLHLNLRLTDAERMGDRLDTAASRLALSIVVGASIVGSAVLIASGHTFTLPLIGSDAPIAELSFFISLVLGLRLLWGLLRAKSL